MVGGYARKPGPVHFHGTDAHFFADENMIDGQEWKPRRIGAKRSAGTDGRAHVMQNGTGNRTVRTRAGKAVEVTEQNHGGISRKAIASSQSTTADRLAWTRRSRNPRPKCVFRIAQPGRAGFRHPSQWHLVSHGRKMAQRREDLPPYAMRVETGSGSRRHSARRRDASLGESSGASRVRQR